MSVVAWDGCCLAADRLGCRGAHRLEVLKVWRVNGLLVGGAGKVPIVAALVDWIRSGRDPEAFPKRARRGGATVLVIERDLTSALYSRSSEPQRFDGTRNIAIGSGGAYALAAMVCGRSAREAIEVASAIDPHRCGAGVDELELDTDSSNPRNLDSAPEIAPLTCDRPVTADTIDEPAIASPA